MKTIKETYLDEVKAYSVSQGEPEWMLALRLAALDEIDELALPVIERVKFHRWPLVEHNAWEETNLEMDSQVIDPLSTPTFIQGYNKTLASYLPNELVEKGVIFTDLQTAIKEHSALVKEYYMQLVVTPHEDKLTAFHAAFMNSGMFLYVPKNVVIEEPFEAVFYQLANSNVDFTKHLLIVADENSSFSYVERFETIGSEKVKSTANVVVEVIAKQGAQVKYSGIDQFGENTSVYINRRAHIMRDASVDWALGVLNDGNVIADFDSDLVGEGAHSEVKVVALSAGRQVQGIDTRVTNYAPHTVGHILQHGVIRERGTLTFNGIGHILKGAKGSDAQQESRVMMLSDKARGDANPILLIDDNDVTAGHAASVGRVDPEDMYYLMSRGLDKVEAERLVIRGFLGSVLTEIPVKSVREELAEVIEGKLK